MEQQIRFCTSADGTRLAFSTAGGSAQPPLILVHAWVGSMDQGSPWFDPFEAILAHDRALVRFDRRGIGMSQRDVGDLSLDAQLADLDAVREALSAEQVDLLGLATDGSAVAAAYAARHPERVKHLVLCGPYARGADVSSPDQTRGLAELARGNWPMAARAIAGLTYPKGPLETQQGFAREIRRVLSGEVAARYIELQATIDLTELLPQVGAPALIIMRRGDRFPPRHVIHEVAELIPGARLLVFEGDSPASMDWGKAGDAVRRFLEEGQAPEMAPAPRGLVTILFTDITDSTALTQHLGDAKAQELVRAHNVIVREALAANGGSEIKHTGDGIMASFPTASGALECAIAIQRAVEASNRAPRPATRDPLAIHIGLNAGEPVAEESDLFGTAVQLARRICDHAEAGQILASNVVRELAAGKGFLFADIGEVVPKGFDEAVRLYEVRWRD